MVCVDRHADAGPSCQPHICQPMPMQLHIAEEFSLTPAVVRI
jgi:hypothetical protein